jgi:serine protease
MPDANLPLRSRKIIGHGVAVSGIIAASTNNNLGVSGIASNVNILPINVYFDWDYDQNNTVIFQFDILDLIEAMNFARQQNADVINMSFRGYKAANSQANLDALTNSINLAKQNGIVVVSSAGNNNEEINNVYPAGLNNHIVVGSVNNNGSRAYYSNYGTEMDLVGVADASADVRTLDRAGTFTKNMF